MLITFKCIFFLVISASKIKLEMGCDAKQAGRVAQLIGEALAGGHIAELLHG